jgi:hypothetical protein
MVACPPLTLFSIYHGKYATSTPGSFFRILPPLRNPEAKDKPESYVYGDTLSKRLTVSRTFFEDGHLSSWGDGAPGRERFRIKFSSYQEVGGFWFPRVIRCERSNGNRTVLRFSNLSLMVTRAE